MAFVGKRMTARGEVRWDVEHLGPDGRKRSRTFKRRRDADTFARSIETSVSEGSWIDPASGKVTLGSYATSWLASRATLSRRTHELYESQLRLHILPGLGEMPMNRVSPGLVRQWHASKLSDDSGVGANTVAKCYRLLHTVFETAVVDEVVRRNPCRIDGAGKERYRERPTATVVEVFELADVVKPQRRALVLLAGFSGLRVGELLALRRRHIDVLHRRIIVREASVELRRGELVTKAPKSEAGVRNVHLDPVLFAAIEAHLHQHTETDPDALLFTGDKGGSLRRAVWFREWDAARKSVGLAHLRFHDLRHTHGTLVARSGGTMKETMRRLGHSTIQAAMVYQHATDDRDQELAEAIGERIAGELRAAAEAVRRSAVADESG